LNTVGHGVHPGAIRIIACDAGYSLSGVPDGGNAVVCDSNGAWSDNGNAQCIIATPAPTAQPTFGNVIETVTCCLLVDNFIVNVIADGAQLSIRLPSPNSIANLKQFQFAASVSTLVIHAGDYECGCRCGENYANVLVSRLHLAATTTTNTPTEHHHQHQHQHFY
jgi:hypothetical protein